MLDARSPEEDIWHLIKATARPLGASAEVEAVRRGIIGAKCNGR
jgi:hypothetical protein